MSLTVSKLGAEDKDSRPPSGLGAEFSEKRPGRGNHGDSGSRKKFGGTPSVEGLAKE